MGFESRVGVVQSKHASHPAQRIARNYAGKGGKIFGAKMCKRLCHRREFTNGNAKSAKHQQSEKTDESILTAKRKARRFKFYARRKHNGYANQGFCKGC